MAKKEEVGNGFGIASFIFSLIGPLSLALFVIWPALMFYDTPLFSIIYSILEILDMWVLYIPIISPILGIIFAVIQMRRKQTKLAAAGLIISIVSIVLFFSLMTILSGL